MAGLLDIPKEVAHATSPSVCKTIKLPAEDYLEKVATMKSCLKIKFQNRNKSNLNDILNTNFTIPVTKIDIDNQPENIWIHQPLKDFVVKYGNRITELRLWQLKVLLCSDAQFFFESLPNLQHFTIKRNLYAVDTEVTFTEDKLPDCLKSLKTLEVHIIDMIDMSGLNTIPTHSYNFYRNLQAANARTMEFLKYPLHIRSDWRFPDITNYVFSLVKPRLQYYDLENDMNDDTDWVEWETDYNHYRLLANCKIFGTKILNYDARMIEGLLQLKNVDVVSLDEGQPETLLASCLVSIGGLRESVCLLELPNLEKITMRGYNTSLEYVTIPNWLDITTRRAAWPNLKILTILVDKPYLADGKPPSELLDFFFVQIKRDKLEELTLGLREFAFPRAREIWTSCSNLKKLTVANWQETNNAISKLWHHLPLLEYLCLKHCPGLANVAFVGKDVNSPTFLKLKRLQSLTLEPLCYMPKITDTLFKLVFRHVPLKQLFLLSRWDAPPVRNVTTSGIRDLLTGVLAKTIEIFPLQGLHLEGLSKETLKAIENEFRSSKML